MTNRLLESLTQPQIDAVTHVDGPLLVLAGPGSGKTRVITHRIANLLEQGVRSHQIVALTFTNKAADEMRQRLDRLVPQQSVWLGTFHRFCARLLRQYPEYAGLSSNYSIYDTRDSKQLLKRTIEEADIDTAHYTPEKIAKEISHAKNNMVTAERYKRRLGDDVGSIVERIYPLYEKALLKSNAVDFDDLLMHACRILVENEELRSSLDERFKYLLVDEYQDTNFVQYLMVRALSRDNPNLGVTGDPDQSIYGWRGASLKNILDFEKDFPQVNVVRLEQNYRSTPNILLVADALITNNKKRKKKELFTENQQGEPVKLTSYFSHKEEAGAIAQRIAAQIAQGKRRARDFAVFYRINALSRTYEDALRNQGVPYMIVSGVEFYHRKEIKDVLAYTLLMNNPSDDVALERVINTPKRSIGKATIMKLRLHALQHGLTMLEAAREAGMVESLSNRSALAVAKFVALFDKLSTKINDPVEQILGVIINDAGFRKQFSDSTDTEDQTRLENIEELLSSAREFDMDHPHDGTLEQYLENKALVNETDNFDGDLDRVTLMTLHAAKGLEFPAVHIVAVEQGLLPHERSREKPEQLEEERRLFFVGITRAEEDLYISTAQYRDFRGRRHMTVPSPFLMELPRDEMEIHEAHVPVAQDSFFEPEPEFEIDQLDSTGETTAPPQTRPFESSSHVMTAADMLGEDSSSASQEQVSPNAFQQGQIVTHEEYGLGKIIALSGENAKRTAVVQFFMGAGEKKFRLAHCNLRPVASSK
ncbi:MAG: ATP-dependent helicase [Pirellulales bacterium]